MPAEWTCTQQDASTTNCVVTVFSDTGSTTPATSEITYLDWLVVNMFLLFMLSILVYGFFFSRFKHPKDKTSW